MMIGHSPGDLLNWGAPVSNCLCGPSLNLLSLSSLVISLSLSLSFSFSFSLSLSLSLFLCHFPPCLSLSPLYTILNVLSFLFYPKTILPVCEVFSGYWDQLRRGYAFHRCTTQLGLNRIRTLPNQNLSESGQRIRTNPNPSCSTLTYSTNRGLKVATLSYCTCSSTYCNLAGVASVGTAAALLRGHALGRLLVGASSTSVVHTSSASRLGCWKDSFLRIRIQNYSFEPDLDSNPSG